MTATLIIADDHPIVRKGLGEIITQSGYWNILAEADSGTSAYRLYHEHHPDLILLDISMGTYGGLEAAKDILSSNKNARVVIMTMYTNPIFYQRAQAIGVQGYLIKDDSAAVILACLEAVHAGKTYVTDSLDAITETDTNTLINPEHVLSDKEFDIFRSIAQLKNNKQIAEEIGVTVKTIQNHRHNIGEKLGQKGKQALLSFAVQWERQ